MKSLLDENVEFRLAGQLRADGHDVTAIAYDYPHALSDEEVLALAVAEQRVLIANDRDFGELIVRQNCAHSGVIYFRLRLASGADEKLAWHRRLLVSHHDRLDQFLVVTSRGVRLREPSRRQP
jgi:predicted nuclease of predicted toxin-antitoxin system